MLPNYLDRSDLSIANFSSAKLMGTVLIAAKILGTNFLKAKLKSANFTNAFFGGVQLST